VEQLFKSHEGHLPRLALLLWNHFFQKHIARVVVDEAHKITHLVYHTTDWTLFALLGVVWMSYGLSSLQVCAGPFSLQQYYPISEVVSKRSFFSLDMSLSTSLPTVPTPCTCCISAMLDPADPSGSARRQDAAACPQVQVLTAIPRGSTQHPKIHSYPFSFDFCPLFHSFQAIPGRIQRKHGQIRLPRR
jgi:hypothetical protein